MDQQQQQYPLDVESLKNQVFAQLRAAMKAANQGGGGGVGFWENVQGFAHAVDWQEAWIRALLGSHLALFVLVLLFRRSTTFLSAVFFALGAAIYFGESLNALAGAHWQVFAGQDYFDAHGVFYSTLVSGPALITLFTVLILILAQASSLMVQVKKREIIHKARAQARAAKQQQQQGAGGGGGGKKQQ